MDWGKEEREKLSFNKEGAPPNLGLRIETGDADGDGNSNFQQSYINGGMFERHCREFVVYSERSRVQKYR